MTELFGVERFSKLNVERRADKVLCTGTITTDKEVPAAQINKIMAENPFILSIERCDDD